MGLSAGAWAGIIVVAVLCFALLATHAWSIYRVSVIPPPSQDPITFVGLEAVLREPQQRRKDDEALEAHWRNGRLEALAEQHTEGRGRDDEGMEGVHPRESRSAIAADYRAILKSHREYATWMKSLAQQRAELQKGNSTTKAPMVLKTSRDPTRGSDTMYIDAGVPTQQDFPPVSPLRPVDLASLRTVNDWQYK